MDIPMVTDKATGNPPTVSIAARVVGSPHFAWVMSVLLHGLVFVGLGVAVFSEPSAPRKMIVPETRLGESLGIPQGPTVVPLRLADSQKMAAPRISTPALDSLPVPTITLDDPILAALPGEAAPEMRSALTTHAAALSASTGPMASLFGEPGNAYKVVYVVDASASLMYYIDVIIEQMHSSIDALLPTQWFHIVLAKPKEVAEFEPRRLVPGTRRYKQQAEAFLATISGIPNSGKPDPIKAFRRAFAANPEMIYFLTDGAYDIVIQDQLLSVLAELNPQREIKITVIGFFRSPLTRPFLERLAREHGGHCRFVEIQ